MSAEEPSYEEMIEHFREVKVADLVLSVGVTFASVVHGKLEAGQLDEARQGIDALAALVRLLEGDRKRDLGQTLTNFQIAYADAVGKASPPEG